MLQGNINLSRKVMERVRRGLSACLLMCFALNTAASAPQPIDAVLLMDSSGSMRQNDPDRLRVPAAKLFISLLGAKDRVSVISFSDDGYPVIGLTSVTGASNRARLFHSVDRVSARGALTNLDAAVVRAAGLLEQHSDSAHRQMIILLSDGAMDTGDVTRDTELVSHMQTDLTTRLRESGIEVHSIAFTDKSDAHLMNTIASATGGMFRLANKDTDLHEVFSVIFEHARVPDMLPVEDGLFQVDSSVQEINLVASKQTPESRIELQTPDGIRFGKGNRPAGVRWFSAPGFELVTLVKPAAGRWQLLSSAGRDKAYIVTNMGLDTNLSEELVSETSDFVAEAWLSRDGEVEHRAELLRDTRFSVRIDTPTGDRLVLDLVDDEAPGTVSGDGVFSAALGAIGPGQYRAQLLAEGPTFQRQKQIYLDIAAAPAVADTVVQEEVAPVAESEPQTAMDPPAEPEASHKLSKREIIGVLLIFLIVNVVIALIGTLVFLFLKKRRQGKESAGEPDTAEAVAA